MIRTVCGDVFEVLAGLEPESFDAIVTDPPYFFEFMGRAFDAQHKRHESPRLDALSALGKVSDDLRAIAWHADWLELARPLLRPGGRVVAASGSRVYHQLATGAALAGLNVDPLFAWINGESMAQGGAIGKLIDKAAGAEREKVRRPYLDGGMQRMGGQNDRPWMEKAARDGFVEVAGDEPATPLARLFEGYSTRLKDAVCPWLMAHRPNAGTWARNAEEHGLAGLAIEAGRVPTEKSTLRPRGMNRGIYGEHTAETSGGGSGRWPSNAAFDPVAARELGRQSGQLRSGSMKPGGPRSGRVTYNDPEGDRGSSVDPNGDEGDASRFFHRFRYNAKTSPAERLRGAERFLWRVDRDHPLGFERITQAEYLAMGHLPGCRKRLKAARPRGRLAMQVVSTSDALRDGYGESAAEDLPLFEVAGLELGDLPEPGCVEGCQHRMRYQGNIHPTLKPIELVRYLARLVLPPDTGRPRRALVPFAGTFSEAIGCALAGFDEVVAIEMEPTYCEIGEARAEAWLQAEVEQGELFG